MQTADVLLQTLDVLLQTPGCVDTDPWNLDVHHILAGNAVAIYKNIFVQNKTTRQYQGI